MANGNANVYIDGSWRASECDVVEFPCPQCDATVRHEMWTVVNAEEDPELVERLKDGTLFEAVCPKCRFHAVPAASCLYLDPIHRACVYLVTDQAMSAQAEEMFRAQAEGDVMAAGPTSVFGWDVIRRIVWDKDDLRGRVIAFENGLDDRVIELLKVSHIGMAKQQGAVGKSDGMLKARLARVEGDELVFELTHIGGVMTATIPRSGYGFYANMLVHSSLAGDTTFYADTDWANRAVDVFGEEGLLQPPQTT